MAAGLGTKLALVAVILLPLALTLTFVTRDEVPLVGVLAGMGGVLSAWYLDREFRELSRPSRLTVLAVQRSGVPSGDRELDELALNRLARAAISFGRYRFVIPVAATVGSAAYLAIPVAAAFHDGAWCLLGLFPAPLLLTELRDVWRNADPTDRWGRLLQELSR